MIQAIVEKGDQTLILDLPYDRNTVGNELAAIGIHDDPQKIYIHDDEDESISVKLYGDDILSGNITTMFDENDTLSTVSTALHLFGCLRREQTLQMTADLEKGNHESTDDMIQKIREFLDKWLPRPHSVIFSKAEIWSDRACEGHFFVGDIPIEYGDLEDADEFDIFIEEEGLTGELTVRVSTYLYGNGESKNADDKELLEIKEKFEHDETWMKKLTRLEDSSFIFEFDEDELFGMNDMN